MPSASSRCWYCNETLFDDLSLEDAAELESAYVRYLKDGDQPAQFLLTFDEGRVDVNDYDGRFDDSELAELVQPFLRKFWPEGVASFKVFYLDDHEPGVSEGYAIAISADRVWEMSLHEAFEMAAVDTWPEIGG